VPDWLKNEVKLNNINWVQDRQIFDDNFFILVKQILEVVSNTHVTKQHEYPYDYYQYFNRLKELSITLG